MTRPRVETILGCPELLIEVKLIATVLRGSGEVSSVGRRKNVYPVAFR